jgi:hypothetical protein
MGNKLPRGHRVQFDPLRPQEGKLLVGRAMLLQRVQ